MFLQKAKKIEIALSQELFNEARRTFTKPKLQPKILSLGFTQDACLELIKRTAIFYPIISLDIPELRDPDDVIVIATAIAAQADVIVSGDKDLLVLGQYHNIPILTAKEFLDGFSNN
jgi:putative PIN family toxin of toxin-antitoxin system